MFIEKIELDTGQVIKNIIVNEEANLLPGFVAIYEEIDDETTYYINKNKITYIKVKNDVAEEIFNFFGDEVTKIRK